MKDPVATAAAASQPGPAAWGLRNEPDWPGFPLGGAVLLLALLAVAAWAWWLNHRRTSAWPWPGALRSADAAASKPQVLHAQRLDAATRLYVLRWHDRELLVCVASQAAPAVLSTHPAAGQEAPR